jgi:hypothetical protein
MLCLFSAVGMWQFFPFDVDLEGIMIDYAIQLGL